MAHIRKTIRDIMHAKLLAADTAAGTKIFKNRVFPYWENELPAITVYVTDEDSSIYNAAPREYERMFQVGVEIVAEANENMDDTLDALALEVEAVFNEDETFRDESGNDRVSDLIYTGSRMSIRDEGKVLAGSLRLDYQVKTYFDFGADPTDLDDFTKAHITYPIESDEDEETTYDEETLEAP